MFLIRTALTVTLVKTVKTARTASTWRRSLDTVCSAHAPFRGEETSEHPFVPLFPLVFLLCQCTYRSFAIRCNANPVTGDTHSCLCMEGYEGRFCEGCVWYSMTDLNDAVHVHFLCKHDHNSQVFRRLPWQSGARRRQLRADRLQRQRGRV